MLNDVTCGCDTEALACLASFAQANKWHPKNAPGYNLPKSVSQLQRRLVRKPIYVYWHTSTWLPRTE